MGISACVRISVIRAIRCVLGVRVSYDENRSVLLRTLTGEPVLIGNTWHHGFADSLAQLAPSIRMAYSSAVVRPRPQVWESNSLGDLLT